MELAFPSPADASRQTLWKDDCFSVAGEHTRVLAYDIAPSGWTDELTALHEETGGSDHFIDVASRRYAMDEVMRCASPGATVLEIGCSSGFLLRELLARLPDATVVGADYTRGTLETLGRKLPGVPLLQFDLTRCPLPGAFADVSVLLNVLEHIGDHEAALRHLFRITKPGGAVIIEVPAGSSLFDVYDRVLMHHRRYDMKELVGLVTTSGFVVERQSHLGFFFYPAFFLKKRINQYLYPANAEVDEKTVVAEMISATRKTSRIMSLVMDFERALRPHLYYPKGVRCLITCRKPARAL